MSGTPSIIIGISFIIIMTTLGSALVFFFKKELSSKLNTIFLGFAAGVMIAAAIWSLILPAFKEAEGYGNLSWLPVAVGFLSGGVFLVILDKIIPLIYKYINKDKTLSPSRKKSLKLFFAVTVHNIPEGLAVGFAFGAAIIAKENSAYMAALGLAIGIGIQNFPEGSAISLPMRKDTKSRLRAFLYGAASGIVEPIFAIAGIYLATVLSSIMPWLLSFAAGAMIFVSVEDLIPDAITEQNLHLGTWSVMFGFVLMMVLDVAIA